MVRWDKILLDHSDSIFTGDYLWMPVMKEEIFKDFRMIESSEKVIFLKIEKILIIYDYFSRHRLFRDIQQFESYFN